MDLKTIMAGWKPGPAPPKPLGGNAPMVVQRKPVSYGRPQGSHMQALGDQMRAETSSALEHMLKESSLRTGLEPLLEKLALAMAAGSPAAHPYRTAPPAMAQAAAPAPAPSGGMMRGLGRTGLALGAGGLAAGALGLGYQHEQDRKQYPLVYAPMTSGYGS